MLGVNLKHSRRQRHKTRTEQKVAGGIVPIDPPSRSPTPGNIARSLAVTSSGMIPSRISLMSACDLLAQYATGL